MALNLIVIVPVNTAGGEYQLIPVTSIAMPVQYTSLSFLSQPLVSSSHNLECVHKETDVGLCILNSQLLYILLLWFIHLDMLLIE